MVLPLGDISSDTRSSYPNVYVNGYGIAVRRSATSPVTSRLSPARGRMRDMLTLSPAARRLIDQAERLDSIQQDESRRQI